MEWVKVSQLCLTLCNPVDYAVHGSLQARILEWIAFPFSRGSSQARDQTQVSHIAGRFFINWAIREACLIALSLSIELSGWGRATLSLEERSHQDCDSKSYNGSLLFFPGQSGDSIQHLWKTLANGQGFAWSSESIRSTSPLFWKGFINRPSLSSHAYILRVGIMLS